MTECGLHAGRAVLPLPRLQTKYAPAAILVRAGALVREQCLGRRPVRVQFQQASLSIQALNRRQRFGLSQPGLPHGSLQHIDGTIVYLQRHRKRMPILAAMATENRAGSLKR